MDEATWLASTDPAAMLHHLQYAPAGVGGRLRGTPEGGPLLVSERKLRLFACSCVRQVWHLLTDDTPCSRCDGKGVLHPRTCCPDCNDNGDGLTPGRINRSRKAVEVAERFADGQATDEAMQEVRRISRGAMADERSTPSYRAAVCASSCCDTSAPHAADFQTRPVVSCPPATQAALLRCLVGNPFRPVVLPHLWRCRECGIPTGPPAAGYYCVQCGADEVRCGPCPWLTPQVLSLAQAAYEERRRQCPKCRGTRVLYYQEVPVGVARYRPATEEEPIRPDPPPQRKACDGCQGMGWLDDGSLDPFRLALVADELEYVGCTNEDMLRHLRRPAMCVWCHNTGNVREPIKKGGPYSGPAPRHVVEPPTDREIPCVCRGECGPHVRGCHVIDSILGKS